MIIVKLVGGLGNQLFIYATARMLQKKYNKHIILNVSSLKELYALGNFMICTTNIHICDSLKELKHKYPLRIRLLDLLPFISLALERMHLGQVKYLAERVLQRIWNRFGFYVVTDGYIPIYWNAHTKDIFVCGFFQSERYFKEVENDIRKELIAKEPPLAHNVKYIKLIESSESVCLHIRRGDYTQERFQDFLVCTPAYYGRSIEKMREVKPNAKFFVFSDDSAWAKDNVPCENAIYVEERNPAYEELRLMSTCRHFIISNSSFSWWAQYLSGHPGKIVIAPDRWLNSDKKCDIWQDHWIRIPV